MSADEYTTVTQLARVAELLEELKFCSMSSGAQVRVSELRDIVALLRAAERQPTFETLQLLLEQSQKENALLYEELTQLKARIKELMNHLSSSGT